MDSLVKDMVEAGKSVPLVPERPQHSSYWTIRIYQICAVFSSMTKLSFKRYTFFGHASFFFLSFFLISKQSFCYCSFLIYLADQFLH